MRNEKRDTMSNVTFRDKASDFFRGFASAFGDIRQTPKYPMSMEELRLDTEEALARVRRQVMRDTIASRSLLGHYLFKEEITHSNEKVNGLTECESTVYSTHCFCPMDEHEEEYKRPVKIIVSKKFLREDELAYYQPVKK
jgi:hypothetical protein